MGKVFSFSQSVSVIEGKCPGELFEGANERFPAAIEGVESDLFRGLIVGVFVFEIRRAGKPGLEEQPAVDAIGEAIVFDVADVVGVDVGQAAFEVSHDVLAVVTGQDASDASADQPGQGMTIDGSAGVEEVRDIVLTEHVVDVMLVVVESANDDGDVAIADVAVADEVFDLTGQNRDFVELGWRSDQVDVGNCGGRLCGLALGEGLFDRCQSRVVGEASVSGVAERDGGVHDDVGFGGKVDEAMVGSYHCSEAAGLSVGELLGVEAEGDDGVVGDGDEGRNGGILLAGEACEAVDINVGVFDKLKLGDQLAVLGQRRFGVGEARDVNAVKCVRDVEQVVEFVAKNAFWPGVVGEGLEAVLEVGGGEIRLAKFVEDVQHVGRQFAWRALSPVLQVVSLTGEDLLHDQRSRDGGHGAIVGRDGLLLSEVRQFFEAEDFCANEAVQVGAGRQCPLEQIGGLFGYEQDLCPSVERIAFELLDDAIEAGGGFAAPGAAQNET